jgi:hypothetical protein
MIIPINTDCQELFSEKFWPLATCRWSLAPGRKRKASSQQQVARSKKRKASNNEPIPNT